MDGGKIESERLDVALDDIGQRAPGPAMEIKPLANRPLETKPLTHEDFEVFINAAGQRATGTAARSPRRYIADFVMPKIFDPTVLQSERSLTILERLAARILPNLEDGEELRALAGALIADEIARHRDLLTRLHNGIAA
jgi:hypothetical protein